MKHKTNTTEEIKEAVAVAAVDPTLRDAMTALLIVSLTINMFFLIGWVALQVTSVYDSEVASFLFTR
jgi:hypothetical protein